MPTLSQLFGWWWSYACISWWNWNRGRLYWENYLSTCCSVYRYFIVSCRVLSIHILQKHCNNEGGSWFLEKCTLSCQEHFVFKCRTDKFNISSSSTDDTVKQLKPQIRKTGPAFTPQVLRMTEPSDTISCAHIFPQTGKVCILTQAESWMFDTETQVWLLQICCSEPQVKGDVLQIMLSLKEQHNWHL